MFLKRFIILAAGALLSIAAFVIYFEYSKAQMEERFRAERERFHVNGPLQLTAANATIQPSPAPAPMPASSNDTNSLIGPVPPSASATPSPDAGSTSTPAPADSNALPLPAPAADSNAAPATPIAPSTLNFPHLPNAAASVFQFAAYRPDLTPFRSAIVFGQTSAAPQAAAVSPTVAATPAPAVASSAAVPEASTGENGKVIVLLYHQFRAAGVAIPKMFRWTMNQDVFESEMKYIHDNGYKVIPMSDLLKFLHHEITLPDNCVCITVDDGYKSPLLYAKPILDKYGYPWTFFIYPQFINATPSRSDAGAASWPELLELQKEGVDIECHSMTHPILTKHGSKSPEQYAAWLENETAGAKKILEQHMGKQITCFAYPYGEWNKQVQAAVISAGFDAIFTVADNPVHATTNIKSIGRYTITREVEKNFMAYLRQGALELTSADPAPGAIISNPSPVITATLRYPDPLDPKAIETSLRDIGIVKHDFDPATNTLRMYLPRPLIQPVEFVNVRVRDARTGQYMVANWQFNYEPGAGAAVHPPIPTTVTPSPAPKAGPTTQSIEKNTPGATVETAPAPAPVVPKTD